MCFASDLCLELLQKRRNSSFTVLLCSPTTPPARSHKDNVRSIIGYNGTSRFGRERFQVLAHPLHSFPK